MKHAIALIAVTALPLLAACSGSTPKAAAGHHATPAASAAASRAGADCSKLATAAFPPAAYDKLVIREVSRLAGGGDASAAQERKARATIAREIRSACPQFAGLLNGS